jgi:transposase
MRELRAASGKKTIASTVLVPAVAERLGVDNATAQKLIGRYSKAESQRTARN